MEAQPNHERWKQSANAAMTKIARGDDASFPALYDALAPRLRAFFVRRTRDDSRSADLLQQTFLKIHSARRRFVPEAEVAPWAFTIAHRVLIDHARSTHERALASAEDLSLEDVVPAGLAEDPERLVERRQLNEHIHSQLARLPHQHQAAFRLVKYEELSIAEAAHALGTTTMAVKLRTHRAYAALRVALADAPS
jgi:RNA polymerase sigma-70 factor (ECF subfamily)